MLELPITSEHPNQSVAYSYGRGVVQGGCGMSRGCRLDGVAVPECTEQVLAEAAWTLACRHFYGVKGKRFDLGVLLKMSDWQCLHGDYFVAEFPIERAQKWLLEEFQFEQAAARINGFLTAQVGRPVSLLYAVPPE